MLANLRTFFDALNASGVRYCHWKSNTHLAEGLSGHTDIDLLVRREDASAFRALLARFCFRPAADQNGSSVPSTEHYFAMDSETGVLAHVHAYYRVITGESLAKNFHFPLEDMLLDNCREDDSLPVPTKAAELVVFTIRMMLKHTALVELALLARDWKGLKEEASSLIDDESAEGALDLVKHWLPSIDPTLFARCISALRGNAHVWKRAVLASRLRWNLRIYARHSCLQATWNGIRTFIGLGIARLRRKHQGLVLQSGGAVVAFVGPEATGKSTLIEGVRAWLGEHFVVTCMHAGKPRSTIVTFLPDMLVPLLRRTMPGNRTSALEVTHAPDVEKSGTWVYPVSFAIRSVLLAYERRVLLTRAFARAANGAIVLCDRFPSMARGAPDGPRLMHYAISREKHPVRGMLASLERHLYMQMPSPDLIISLATPIEVALARNRSRGKYEPEDYVRRRHSAAALVTVDDSRVCPINTNRPLEETLRDVKSATWRVL